MHKSTKNKAMAALTIASMAGLYGYAAAPAKGVLITSYYNDGNTTTTLGNAVQISTTSNFAAGTVTTVTINPTAPAVTMTSGEYLRMGISAVVTNNNGTGIQNSVSGSAWDNQNVADGAEPAPKLLGLDALAYQVASSDVSATYLQPRLGAYIGTISSGDSVYQSSGTLNSHVTTPLYGAATTSTGTIDDTAAPGDVGVISYPQISPISIGYAAGTVDTQGAGGQQEEAGEGVPSVGAFSGSTDTVADATSVIGTLIYKAVGNNVAVTLTPSNITAGDNYWTVGSEGTTVPTGHTPSGYNPGIGSDPSYTSVIFNSVGGNTATAMAPLVITIGTLGPSGPIITLTSTNTQSLTVLGDSGTTTPGAHMGKFTPTSGGTNVLHVSGSNGSYVSATVTNIDNGVGDSGDDLQISGFNPSNDNEVIALELLNNGSTPTAAQLTTIAGDIDSANTGVTAMTAAQEASSDPGVYALFPNYDIFLTFSSSILNALSSGTNNLGINFAGYSDATNSVSNVTVIDIGVVPEPGSMLGVLALGGLGMFAQRRRRKPEAEKA